MFTNSLTVLNSGIAEILIALNSRYYDVPKFMVNDYFNFVLSWELLFNFKCDE